MIFKNIGNYAFGYNEDHATGGTFRRETGDAHGNKIGSYGLRDADGRLRIVNYVADALGYRANIQSNEPGVEPKDPAATLINKPGLAPLVPVDEHPVVPVAHAPLIAAHGHHAPLVHAAPLAHHAPLVAAHHAAPLIATHAAPLAHHGAHFAAPHHAPLLAHGDHHAAPLIAAPAHHAPIAYNYATAVSHGHAGHLVAAPSHHAPVFSSLGHYY